MPSTTAVDEFVSLVEQGMFVEAMERFYADDAVVEENLSSTRRGKEGLIQHERGVLRMWKTVEARCEGAPLINGDAVAIHWQFRFEAANGASVSLDEIALQRWRGDQLVHERFYYDPAQMTPKQPG